MSAIYELNELEIDEISLVDQGANEGAEVTLMKRHEPEELTKRLQLAEEELKLHKMADIANRLWPNLAGSNEDKALVLKHVDGMDKPMRSMVLKFLAAANAVLHERLIEKGVTQSGDEVSNEAAQFELLAQDYAGQHDVSLQVAKMRLVAEDKGAAKLFRTMTGKKTTFSSC
jgi:hypothetical protein